MSAPPMEAAPGADLGVPVPMQQHHMPQQQEHHEHNGQHAQPHEQQMQPVVGAEDVVKLFGFITSEFRGFLAHVEQAVQVCPGWRLAQDVWLHCEWGRGRAQ